MFNEESVKNRVYLRTTHDENNQVKHFSDADTQYWNVHGHFLDRGVPKSLGEIVKEIVSYNEVYSDDPVVTDLRAVMCIFECMEAHGFVKRVDEQNGLTTIDNESVKSGLDIASERPATVESLDDFARALRKESQDFANYVINKVENRLRK